ncbi:MAG: heavy metal translocating P-type ATPase [Promethearchaeota archaeon]
MINFNDLKFLSIKEEKIFKIFTNARRKRCIKISSCRCTESFCKHEDFFSKYFWFFIISSIILLGFSIFIEVATNRVILSQALAIISIAFSSYGILSEALEDIREKKITASILMIIAAVASFFILHGQEGATAILLFAIAENLEELTMEKSKNAVQELYELAPDESLLKIKEEYKEVPTKDVKKGDIIGIKPGMKAPLDGFIVKGKSYFNESAITGESIPVFKQLKDAIFAASINSDSFVDIEVTCESNNTIVAQIAESIKIAQQNKSKHERFIEKFAKYYTPIILVFSLLIMIIPPLFLNLDFNDWFYRGLILLVISCPCALTLSTPLANIIALTKLAREGILVKGNIFMEKIDEIEVFAFDKTGTLTEGNLKIFEIITYNGIEKDVLTIAASLEALSEHPIGKAIVNKAKQMELNLNSVDNYLVIKGKGIKGEISGKLYHVGSYRFFNELNYELPKKTVNELGVIPILVGNSKELLGIIQIRDVLRISAPFLINELHKKGHSSVLISGDNQNVCETIGECLNITDIKGELLPEQKLQEIRELKKRYKGVAMVGDGINDAPALALSDLGIAIGASATDIALETADVIIMSNDLKKLNTFIDISKKTNKIIRQNIWTSIIVKVLFAFLTINGLMTLIMAVGIGDGGVSLLVMFNSMRILRYKIKYKDLSEESLQSKAKMLVCENCQTKNIIPQHHGRDMIQKEDKLVCWKKIMNSNELEPCEEDFPLNCPYCKKKLQVV